MNTWISFAAAVVCMVAGHMFKVLRWGKIFISVYEKPCISNLLNAMSVGHVINTILPVRIGDIFRMVWSGKKLKNGCSFSIATVIVDLYIDLSSVGMIILVLMLTGKGGVIGRCGLSHKGFCSCLLYLFYLLLFVRR